MKKTLVILLLVLAALAAAAGGVLLVAWNGVDAGAAPEPQVAFYGQALSPLAVRWHQPVLGGLLYKELQAGGGEATALGEVSAGDWQLQTEAGYTATAALVRDAVVLYRGPADALPGEWLDEAGEYTLTLTCEKPRQQGEGYGTFTYEAGFTLAAPPAPEVVWPDAPVLQAGRTTLAQGEILALELLYVPEGVQPTAQTELGMAVFTPKGEGRYLAVIPVGNTRAPGEYTVAVQAGEAFFEVPVTVEPYAFVEQDLTIDVSDPVISEANSPEAYQQYRDTIPPLFETADEQSYWEGVFLRPAEGRVSTEFGTIRYTNGDYANPGIHNGMDIANAEGTPVIAPNHGRVVLAQNLLNTGNTIVIEHGGGLKSYYFHMSRLDVQEGQMVEKGDEIGAIGTTGYSTGPHLHYEMRIGNQPVSPSLLFEPKAGLYSLESTLELENGEENP